MKQTLIPKTILIALAFLLMASLVSGTAVINIYLDDLPASATYTIKTDGTNYWAVRYDGYKAFESTNASYVINSAWVSAALTGGTIFLKSGNYNFGTSYLLLHDSVGTQSVDLIGEMNPNGDYTVIRGTGSYLVSSDRSEWLPSANGAFHSIKNIRFEHTTGSSSDITLNLAWVMVNLQNVWISNMNAIKQGTGLYIGTNEDSGSYTGNTGHSINWQSISVSSYDVNYNVSVDHLTATNLISYYADTYNFIWRWSAWSSINNLQIAPESGGITDAYMLYFDYLGQGLQMFNVNIEGSGTTFNQDVIFYVNPYHNVGIYGFFMQGTIGNKDAGHVARFWVRDDTNGTAEYYVYLEAHSGSFLSEYSGFTTVADNEDIAHGLLNQPYQIQITVEDDITYGVSSVPVVVGAISKDSTNFRVGVFWVNGTAISDDTIEIYWWASVNRR